MALGTPYTIVSGSQAPSVSTTLQVTVSATSAAGDAIVVGAGANAAAGPVVSGVTDSQGNTYVLAVSDYAQSLGAACFVALGTTPLVNGVDWIKATFTTNSGSHALVGRGCSGVAAFSAVDETAFNDGAGGASMTASTGTRLPVSEWAVAFAINGNAGGVPTAWTGGFTSRATAHATNNEYLTVADQIARSTAALTAGATITPTVWEMLAVTLQVATAPAYPLTSEVRSPLPPRHPRAGRASGSQGAPVSNTTQPHGPTLYPLQRPVRTPVPRPPRGRATGSQGAPRSNQPSGPPFRQQAHPARGIIPRTFSQGRCRFASATTPAQNATAGPRIYPLRAPVRTRITLPPHGRAAGSVGAPVANPPPVMAGPALYPLRRPVGAVLPMRGRGGRSAGSKGAPVSNPAASGRGNLLTLFP